MLIVFGLVVDLVFKKSNEQHVIVHLVLNMINN